MAAAATAAASPYIGPRRFPMAGVEDVMMSAILSKSDYGHKMTQTWQCKMTFAESLDNVVRCFLAASGFNSTWWTATVATGSHGLSCRTSHCLMLLSIENQET